MKKIACVLIAAAAVTVAAIPSPAAAAVERTPRCTSVRPSPDFYAGGRVASTPIDARCTTVSISHVRDVARPSDRCQTFLVALLSADGRDPTYTEPVRVCSPSTRTRTVIATGVPAGSQFRVLYQVDYLEQSVRFTVWR
ncbi:hypothetical protein [Actinoplanes solisilvae]|uniref:hypothetical protein n=1 Tax=Actinoplanes solisilvae TaxID=2486853 RepID=UPI000FD70142|nr:hypothetical protein [Actinoplanes solisilvae]